mmetsp:Transcript_13795/g.44242  ORF Transcript_13795/g.44242 Transcript_13795/m.44242 type:complete len:211 (+) Transcript_13795:557-1189(+)
MSIVWGGGGEDHCARAAFRSSADAPTSLRGRTATAAWRCHLSAPPAPAACVRRPRLVVRPVEQVRRRLVRVVLQQLARPQRRVVGREAEALLHLLGRRRAAEGAHADHRVRVLAPPLRREGLHRQHGHAGRQHLVLVLARLGVEELATRHRDELHAHTLQQRHRLLERLHLGTGADQHQLRRPSGRLPQHVGAPRNRLRPRPCEVGAALP